MGTVTSTYTYSPCDLFRESYIRCLASGGKTDKCIYVNEIYTSCLKEQTASK